MDKIEEYADDILKSVARLSGIKLSEISNHIEVSREKLTKIEAHLEKLNSQVTKNKDAITILEYSRQQIDKAKWLTFDKVFQIATALLIAYLIVKLGL